MPICSVIIGSKEYYSTSDHVEHHTLVEVKIGCRLETEGNADGGSDVTLHGKALQRTRSNQSCHRERRPSLY